MSSAWLFRLLATLCILVPLTCTPAIDARYSASWYDPARNGEGWVLEILSPGLALLYWFTYDEDGGQRWLTAVGSIDGQQIDFPDLVLTTGGRFGPDFDPDEVVRSRVGSAQLEFDDCNGGRFHYQGFEQEQTLAFKRLTSTHALYCSDDGEPVDNRHSGRSGSWYDPTRSGEGYTLHWMSESTVLMIWFSFDPEGNQHWMLGVGTEQDDGSMLFPGVHDTRGARFGVDFDPDDVERRSWGDLRLNLDCDTGSAAFAPVASGFVDGTYALQHLTRLMATTCASADWSQAQWRMSDTIGPRLSEMPGAALGDYFYVTGGLLDLTTNTAQHWRYHPATDTWQRRADLPAARDHAMMAASDDAIYLFGGYVSGPGNAVASNLAWRYDPDADAWSAIAPMPQARAAGGSARIGRHIYLAGGIDGSSLSRYDIETGSWTTQAIVDSAPRDHSVMVALNGELWLLGGRGHHDGEAHGVVRIIDPATGNTRAGPNMPRGRSGFAAAVVVEGVLVTGGENLWPAQMIGGADLYSVRDQQWLALANPPQIVHGGPALVHRGRYYLLLGSTAAGAIFSPGRVQILERP